MDNLRNKTYKTGIQADTDIHNGGTIFGIAYRQVLSFDNFPEAKLSYEIVFDRSPIESWRTVMHKIYSGFCINNEKHIKISFTNPADKIVMDYYFKEIENDMLLCEIYTYNSADPNYKNCESKVFVLDK